MPEPLPSPEGGATLNSGPATGNNAPVGATPAAATLSLEEATRRLAELEHAHSNATEELQRHRTKLSAYEKTEKEQAAAKEAADLANLAEIDRVKKQHADIQAQYAAQSLELQETRISHAVEQEAHSAGFIYPESVAHLLDMSEVEFDERGHPTNIKKLVEKLAKNMPRLIEQAAPASGTQPQAALQAQPGTPALPAMNPGRTSIAQPGTSVPGRPVRLADIRRT
jgi:tRNA U34 5-carboxymethylaminomethyl modifying enzyme MnmG/GidA